MTESELRYRVSTFSRAAVITVVGYAEIAIQVPVYSTDDVREEIEPHRPCGIAIRVSALTAFESSILDGQYRFYGHEPYERQARSSSSEIRKAGILERARFELERDRRVARRAP
jgi:hypothetical protein